jgi:branched-chain amino acid transport system substrate-binding protein
MGRFNGAASLAGALLLALSTGAAPAETYDINVVLPLTGRTSFLGQSEQKALQILEKVVNREGGIGGQQLRFVFHDDQSSPQTAVQLTSQIVAGRPAVLLGSAQVAMCNAMGPLARSGPVMYCLSPGIHPKDGEFIFTSSVSTHDLAGALIRYARLRGWTRIALITTTDASGQDAERGVKDVMARPENAGLQLVENAHFNPADLTVSAQIEQIKATNPHILIAWTTGSPVATVFKAVAQAGLEIPVATTNGNMTQAQMQQYAGFLPKDLYIPSSEWPEHDARQVLEEGIRKAQRRFFDAFKAENAVPDSASTLSWDPAMIVVDAIRALGAKATAAQLRQHLAQLKNYAGVSGMYDFTKTPQRGLDETAAVVTLWNPSKKVWEVITKPTGVPLDR